MKLLKFLVICFIIYFIRRFFQMYRYIKAKEKEEVINNQPNKAPEPIEAEFKNLDN